MNFSIAKRVVIKVGTSTLTHENGTLNLRRMEQLVRTASELQNQGKEILLVTSGAIGVGFAKLHMKGRPSGITERQAAAAVGQCELMNIYERLFSTYGYTVAQILLTRDVMDSKIRRNHVENTIHTLIDHRVIPIFNENDCISTDEIGEVFGDNDTLSAHVAKLANAQLLIILSDIDGLYDSDPKTHPKAKLIPLVAQVDTQIEAIAGGVGSNRGTGGMATKIKAVKIAQSHDIPVFIANGAHPEILYDIFDGKAVGTLFANKPTGEIT